MCLLRLTPPPPNRYSEVESGLVFIGLAALQDPPRPEVAPAIKRCRQAGIRGIVLTGDNKSTAEAICRKIGVFGTSEDLEGKSLTGECTDLEGRGCDALDGSNSESPAAELLPLPQAVSSACSTASARSRFCVAAAAAASAAPSPSTSRT